MSYKYLGCVIKAKYTHYRQRNDGVSADGEGDDGIGRVRKGIAAPVCGEDGTDDKWDDGEEGGDEEEGIVKTQKGRHCWRMKDMVSEHINIYFKLVDLMPNIIGFSGPLLTRKPFTWPFTGCSHEDQGTNFPQFQVNLCLVIG